MIKISSVGIPNKDMGGGVQNVDYGKNLSLYTFEKKEAAKY